MQAFWQTKTGKLFMGACGTQIGLFFALGGLLVSLLFCSICVSVNVLSVSVKQVLASPATATRPPASEDGTKCRIDRRESAGCPGNG